MLSPILSVFRFEWKRSLTVRQWIGFGILSLVPALIMLLLRMEGDNDIPKQVASRIMFYLIPEVLCLLNLLLLATPVIYAELEGKNWVYIATRPRGKLSHLVGKYAAAVSRTILCSWISLVLAVLVAQPLEMIKFTLLISCLVVFSAITYGAIFCFIGVLMHRRAMVVAVGYTLVMEFLVSNVPALINRFSIQYRLFSIFLNTMAPRKGNIGFADMMQFGEHMQAHPHAKIWDWEYSAMMYHTMYGYAATMTHIGVLTGITGSLLIASSLILKRREYLNVEDS